MAAPLMKAAGSEQTNATTRPKLAGSPMGTPSLIDSSLIRSVACRPGHTVLMVMPSSKTSVAAVLAQAHSPVRAALDIDRLGIGCLIDDDVIRHTRPQWRARMWGTASFTNRA